MSLPLTPTSDDHDAVLGELLSAHADALIAGRPFSVAGASADAYALMQLAGRLREALPTVAPSPAFLARLQEELIATPTLPPATISARWRNLPARYRRVAQVGGLTLTAGLALIAGFRALDAVRTGRQGRDMQEPSLLTGTP